MMRRLGALHGMTLALALVALAPNQLSAQERGRGAPPKNDQTLIVPLPAEAPGARCQAETIRAAFVNLGALETLGYVSSDLADSAAAGGEALTSYCTDHAEECGRAAAALAPKIGEVPTSCNGAEAP